MASALADAGLRLVGSGLPDRLLGSSVLAARLRALAETGDSVGNAENVSLPLDKDILIELFNDHRQALSECVSEYHQMRAEIDSALDSIVIGGD